MSRIDFSTIFEVRDTPKAYFSVLNRLSRFNRVEEKNTLYFKTEKVVILFYDKIKHLNSKTPSEYIGKNILRFEVRLMKGLRKRFGYEVSVPMLYDSNFFQSMLAMYKDYYFKIEKNYALDIDYSKAKTPRGMINLIVGLKANLGLDVNAIINNSYLDSKKQV